LTRNAAPDSEKRDGPSEKNPARRAAERARKVVNRDIWELDHLGKRGARARFYAFLRVAALTFDGLKRNRIPVQSAALTFSSLIGLGPLIAIGIMVSSFVIERGDENMAVDALARAIAFAAPQTTITEDARERPGEADAKGGGRSAPDGSGRPAPSDDAAGTEAAGEGDAVVAARLAERADVELNEDMVEILDNVVRTAQSGTVGVVGTLMLLVIGIQVLSSIESSFNHIWGVRRGRKIGERIVFYWTFISLGAVLGAAALTLLTVTQISAFAEKLPFGETMLRLVLIASPILAFGLLVLLLALFFRFIPNTRVEWSAAFVGATVVVALLHLYNKLSFLYVEQVVRNQSLYGSVGIVIVLMLGLYVFWLLVLLGGQVTYACQNADYLTNENAWQNTSHRARELVALAAIVLIARGFRQGEPLHASELTRRLRVPAHIMNLALHYLREMGLVRPVESAEGDDERDRAYLPAQPLDALTFAEFKERFERYGNNEGAELVRDIDPVVRRYCENLLAFHGMTDGDRPLAELLESRSEPPPPHASQR